jgi:V8-like Glu-specific endopeptidase
MSLLKRGLSLGLSLFSTGALAQNIPKVVYGADNRVEVYEASSSMQSVAARTAAMIPMERLKLDVSETDPSVKSYTTIQTKLKEEGICPDDRFADQPTPGMCSGFLVGPDLLVTAGHCARTLVSCQGNAWVFGFAMDATTQTAGVNIPVEQVYRCKELVNQKLNSFEGSDHALIRLDRVVTGLTPLNLRTTGKIEDNTGIVVIGHPMGLPTKISDGANVRTNVHPHYFVANLDTFGGNSGSAVFNTNDLSVEGILVRGETDYKYNSAKGCQEVYVCDDDKCRGEDVTRITDIIELAQRDQVLAAAASGDVATLDAYIAAKGWINIYDNSLNTLLSAAAGGQQAEMVSKLLALGVDAQLNNVDGQTPLHKLAGIKNATVATESVFASLSTAGVKIDAQDKDLNTALHLAVKANNIRMVILLVDAGANPRLENALGKTPMELTDWFSLKDRKIRSALKKSLKR